MLLKDILIHIDDTDQCMHRLDLAVDLARRHGAHLTGLYIIAPVKMPVYAEVHIPVAVFEQQERTARENAEKAERAFAEKTDEPGFSSEWRCERGLPIATLNLHSRSVDLVIVGQDNPKADELASGFGKAALECGRPVLVYPHDGTMTSCGQRVVIAWNSSRESARAVNDALPLLHDADRVTVLTIDPGPRAGSGNAVPGADIARHLDRHGIDASTNHIAKQDAGESLLSFAVDEGADLIVMGTYGHSRFRELVLGGVTRHVLKNMTVPVLMSH